MMKRKSAIGKFQIRVCTSVNRAMDPDHSLKQVCESPG
jgi:hypothetical protein